VNDAALKDIVNRSGFPLQLRVGALVEEATKTHGWRVKYTEHAWRDLESGSTGFVDLLLEDRHGTSTMVVECKRALETAWVFLVPSLQVHQRSHCMAWANCSVGDQVRYSGWHTLQVDPRTAESSYCVVAQGGGKNSQSLESIASDVVQSTRALADAERLPARRGPSDVHCYFSSIVTTASLRVCAFEPGSISLDDGKLDMANFTSVPYLRFRKQLDVVPVSELTAPAGRANDGSLAYTRERTVFIVNAQHLTEFLSEFETQMRELSPYLR
jgi:hypothetical protein